MLFWFPSLPRVTPSPASKNNDGESSGVSGSGQPRPICAAIPLEIGLCCPDTSGWGLVHKLCMPPVPKIDAPLPSSEMVPADGRACGGVRAGKGGQLRNELGMYGEKELRWWGMDFGIRATVSVFIVP